MENVFPGYNLLKYRAIKKHNMTIIEVTNLSLIRGREQVLDEVSFTVNKGEILAIIGPSGSGKSSLLRCLNRLEEPQSETIKFLGTDITELSVTALRRRIGMIFQQTVPFHGSVAENLAYGPALCEELLTRERILELMELSSLEANLADRDATELSGGQEQRLAIARALANDPDVLLLDEPTSALDPVATRHVEESLLYLRNQLGLSLVWVSHSIDQVRKLADRVLLLNQGRVARIDSVAAMFDPESGDEQALAFAAGEESVQHQQSKD